MSDEDNRQFTVLCQLLRLRCYEDAVVGEDGTPIALISDQQLTGLRDNVGELNAPDRLGSVARYRDRESALKALLAWKPQ